MAFTFSGTSGSATAQILQTGSYLTLTASSVLTTVGPLWQFQATINTSQAGSTPADCVGRAIVNTSQMGTITAQRQIASSWISSIGSTTALAANITVQGHRYFLSDGTEEIMQVTIGNTFAVCQNERDLVIAATTDTNTWTDTSTVYPSVSSARTDIPWGQGRPNLIRLGTVSQACRFVIGATGFFCISDNTHIMWAQNGITTLGNPGGSTLDIAGAFLIGRHFTLAVGTTFVTDLLYPGTALTSDTTALSHVAQMNIALQNGAYGYFGSSIGGAVYGITMWERTAATRMHFRKCTLWSVGNTGTGTNPTVFAGAPNAIFTCDELTISGSHVVQRENSIMIIYSLINRGGGYIQAVNSVATTFNNYSNAGSQNGFDFGGFQGFASTGNLNANMILSYNSPAGTNVYAGSADVTFLAGNQQSINLEIHRNLTARAVSSSGVALSNAIFYLKCSSRLTGTAANTPRGAVSATPDGTAATCGQTVTSRSGTTLLTDGIQVQYDRTYSNVSGTVVDVLLGEVYTNALTTVPPNVSYVGRPGYEGNNGLATNRVSRRGKDDIVGSRNNRDQYDIYWWDYLNLFSKATDFSLNANGTQTQIMLVDGSITQTVVATVAAYNVLDSTTRIYDYCKYYKVAPGTVDTRPQLQRLEMGGIDGTTPGAALTAGGGGYLCYDVGASLFFNPIFNGFTINAGTNAAPLGVLSALGPISGSWNSATSAYSYTDARRPTSTTTVQGGLTFFAGSTTVASSGNFTTLNFGTRNVTLNAVATAAATTVPWATIVANQITLGPSVTVFQSLTATPGGIVNLLTAGVIGNSASLSFGSSSIVVTGDLSFTNCVLSPTLTLNVGTTNRTLTLNNCGDLTTNFPFARGVGNTGVISLIISGTTAVPTTLPSGFVYTILTLIQITLTDSPAVQPTVRTIEVYKNGTTVPATIAFVSYSSGVITYSSVSLPADIFNGGISFIDTYTPIRLAQSAGGNALVTGTGIPEVNVDFGQTLSVPDIAFIATTSWVTTNSALATNAYISFLTTQATDYQTTPSTRTAVELAKLVWRRSYETSNVATIAYRRLLAIGTIAVGWISFSQTGVILNQVTGLVNTGIGLIGNKDASRTNLVTFSIWAVDNVGNFFNLNNANGRATSTITTIVLWEGFSPGAVANLSTNQINQVAIGVNIGIVTNLVGTSANPGPLRKMSTGIVAASLLIPATINLDSAENDASG